MAYGVSAPKKSCIYTQDNGDTVLLYHTQDVIDAGSFGSGTSANLQPPSKGRFHPRHYGLKSAAGQHAKCPIATPTAYNANDLGDSFTYAGISWTITSKIGEMTRIRA